MKTFLVMAVGGAITYAIRVAPIALLARRTTPPALDRVLHHATSAVLAALVASAVARGGGAAALLTPSPGTLAATAAGLVAWRTRGVVGTMVVGVGLYGLLSAVWG